MNREYLLDKFNYVVMADSFIGYFYTLWYSLSHTVVPTLYFSVYDLPSLLNSLPIRFSFFQTLCWYTRVRFFDLRSRNGASGANCLFSNYLSCCIGPV